MTPKVLGVYEIFPVIFYDQRICQLMYDDLQEDEKMETHFHVAINCISQALKTQIIGRSNDEVAICFFNTVRFLNDLSLFSSIQLCFYVTVCFFLA